MTISFRTTIATVTTAMVNTVQHHRAIRQLSVLFNKIVWLQDREMEASNLEGFLSCGPLIQTEIDPSATPNSALFSW